MTYPVCLCGNTQFRTVYDRVPYGATTADLPGDEVCKTCDRSIDEAIEWCEQCDRPVDRCTCNSNNSSS